MVSFGENLKKIRAEKNISQGELAEMLGVHATHISRYERDLTQPTLDVIKKLTDALNISADVLIFGNIEEQAKNKINDNELLNLYSKTQLLNKEDVNCIKTFLSAFVFKSNIQKQLY